jgi:hypothetical protein
MSLVDQTRRTKNLEMNIRNGDSRKQAGSNRFQLVVNSEDWRIQDQAVSMTIRDAKALRSFENETLSD